MAASKLTAGERNGYAKMREISLIWLRRGALPVPKTKMPSVTAHISKWHLVNGQTLICATRRLPRNSKDEAFSNDRGAPLLLGLAFRRLELLWPTMDEAMSMLGYNSGPRLQLHIPTTDLTHRRPGLILAWAPVRRSSARESVHSHVLLWCTVDHHAVHRRCLVYSMGI